MHRRVPKSGLLIRSSTERANPSLSILNSIRPFRTRRVFCTFLLVIWSAAEWKLTGEVRSGQGAFPEGISVLLWCWITFLGIALIAQCAWMFFGREAILVTPSNFGTNSAGSAGQRCLKWRGSAQSMLRQSRRGHGTPPATTPWVLGPSGTANSNSTMTRLHTGSDLTWTGRTSS